MSRSYKHSPVCKDNQNGGASYAKRDANKRIRKSKNVPNGNIYKKFYCSYDIHDFISYYTLNDALLFRTKMLESLVRYGVPIAHTYIEDEYANINKVINRWKKNYYRK